jgi:hypothetical protein
LKKKINNLTEYIMENGRQNQAAIEKLRRSYQEQMEREKSRIYSLEIQREEKVKSKQREMEALEHETSQIVSQIEELIRRKKEWMEEIKKMAIPWKVEHATLIHLPFYLIGYKSEGRTELQILPPLKIASPKGVAKKLRKTILSFARASKLKLFIQPRSETLSKMLNSAIKEKTRSNEDFNKVLYQTASSTNILRSQNLRETLIEGLEKLKAEGWIGEDEIDAVIKVYVGG